jgi:hypothetical protein
VRLRRAPHRAKTTVGLLATGIPVFRQVRGRLHSCSCDIVVTLSLEALPVHSPRQSS